MIKSSPSSAPRRAEVFDIPHEQVPAALLTVAPAALGGGGWWLGVVEGMVQLGCFFPTMCLILPTAILPTADRGSHRFCT